MYHRLLPVEKPIILNGMGRQRKRKDMEKIEKCGVSREKRRGLPGKKSITLPVAPKSHGEGKGSAIC